MDAADEAHDEFTAPVVKVHPSELPFESVVNFIDILMRYKEIKAGLHRKLPPKDVIIKKFIDKLILRESGEAFDVFRLILPGLDSDRGNYSIKEVKLLNLFMDELKPAMDTMKLAAPQPTLARSSGGGGGGGSSFVVGSLGVGETAELIERMCRGNTRIGNDASEAQKLQLTVGEVNTQLDKLVHASGDKTKRSIVTFFVKEATPRQIRFLAHIILKDLKLHTSDKSFFKAWHTDAETYFNNTGMSLKAVFNTITSSTQPLAMSLEPGRVARPQLAQAVYSAKAAVLKLKGNGRGVHPFVIETKYDGERIQMHRDGEKIYYYSRKGIDHGEKSKYTVLDDVIKAATNGHDKCILDGEIIVWNSKKKRMEPFGTIKNTINAAASGMDGATLIVDAAVAPSDNVTAADDNIAAPDDDAPEDASADLASASTAPPPPPPSVDDAPLPLPSIPPATTTTAASNGNLAAAPVKLSDLELYYIVMDVLYCKGNAVIHLPLSQRHTLLTEILPSNVAATISGVSGIVAHVVPLLPGQTVGAHVASQITTPDAALPVPQQVSACEEIISEALKIASDRSEEGIVIKRLDSPWISNNRSYTSWMKIKPDYVYKLDIDAVVLGAWFGTGSRGGILSQYLMGLCLEPDPGNTTPTRYVTFCNVGTGLNDEERRRLHRFFVNNNLLSTQAPSCVKKTGRELPQFWVKDPSRSVVLELQADVRLAGTLNHAARLSLRFPRIYRIRDAAEKGGAEATREDELLQIARQKVTSFMEMEEGTKNKRRAASKSVHKTGQLLSALQERQAALQLIQETSRVLRGAVVYVKGRKGKKDPPDAPTAQQLKELVHRLGGKTSESWSPAVTHVVSFLSELCTMEMLKFLQTHPGVSILSPKWLLCCEEKGVLCPLRPRDFLFMASNHRGSSAHEVDSFGDSFFLDADCEDIAALVEHHIKDDEVNAKTTIEYMLLLNSTVKKGSSSSSAAAAAAAAAVVGQLQKARDEQRRRPGVLPSGRMLLQWLDAEFASAGRFDQRRGLLHSCVILCLDMQSSDGGGTSGDGGGSSDGVALTVTTVAEKQAAAAVEAVCQQRFARFKFSAKLHGAKVVTEMSPAVTHIVAVLPSSSPTSLSPSSSAVLNEDQAMVVTPNDLLRAVERQGGGSAGVVALRKAINAHQVDLTTEQWLEDCFAAAAAAVDGGGGGGGGGVQIDDLYAYPNPSAYPMLDSTSDVDAWPWGEYLSADEIDGGGGAVAMEVEEEEVEDVHFSSGAGLPSNIRYSRGTAAQMGPQIRPSGGVGGGAAAPFSVKREGKSGGAAAPFSVKREGKSDGGAAPFSVKREGKSGGGAARGGGGSERKPKRKKEEPVSVSAAVPAAVVKDEEMPSLFDTLYPSLAAPSGTGGGGGGGGALLRSPAVPPLVSPLTQPFTQPVSQLFTQPFTQPSGLHPPPPPAGGGGLLERLKQIKERQKMNE